MKINPSCSTVEQLNAAQVEWMAHVPKGPKSEIARVIRLFNHAERPFMDRGTTLDEPGPTSKFVSMMLQDWGGQCAAIGPQKRKDTL